MPQPIVPSGCRAPRWIVLGGSLVICLHLGALVVNLLASPSGPWLGPEGGPTPGPPPAFAHALNQLGPQGYLSLVKINPNYQVALYHFDSNRPGGQSVYFIANVKDETGKVIKPNIRIPDPKANPWLYHRQQQLAAQLAFDEMVPPRMTGDKVPPKGQEQQTITYWKSDPGSNRSFKLVTVPDYEQPSGFGLMRPSKLSLRLAQSYARYLCREYGGAAVEIIRHTRETIPPTVLEQPPGTETEPEEMVHNFGDLPR
jgi:hypothetical protein